MFLVHNITKIIIMIRVVNDNKCHSSGQSSIPFSTFPTEGKLRDKVFDIGFSGFFKLPNFVIEVNWLIIALIDSCDWGWLG